MNSALADVEKFLAATPPFDLLDAGLLARAAVAFEVFYRRRGSVLLDLGEVNSTLYLVRRGAVEAVDRRVDVCDRRRACGNGRRVARRGPTIVARRIDEIRFDEDHEKSDGEAEQNRLNDEGCDSEARLHTLSSLPAQPRAVVKPFRRCV